MTTSAAIGQGLAQHLGIELRAPRAPSKPTPADQVHPAGEILAEYVGLPTRAVPGSTAPQGSIDRAVSIADRVVRGGAPITDEEREFLWTDPQLVAACSKRLELERAILAKEQKAK